MSAHEELLMGWGNTAPSMAHVERPRSDDEVEALLDHGPLIARGLGRSYGDAAQCAGGTVLSNRSLWHLSPIDPVTGLISVGSGVSLDELLKVAIPAGFFVPVTPGTRQVTIGGAIAADIHGKNHHVEGSFMDHVISMRLATPSGELTVTPESDPSLFWATAGAMGLTGVVTEATIKLLPIETSWVSVDTERFENLDGVMAAMASGDAAYRYSVAWVDCMTQGPRMGRAVLTRGDHAPLSALEGRSKRRPLDPPSASRLVIPFTPPSGLLNRLSISAFNEAWFRKAPKRRDAELHSISSFFHPLDGVEWWNRLHGTRGFLQYQFAVPDSHGEVVRRAIEVLSSAKVPSFLAVLKRFGPGNPGPLSFPLEGWTLALDVPVGPSQLPGVLDQLDVMVAEAGGRLYLAKDSRLSPEMFATMYPRADELMEVARRVDPQGHLSSDLSRRLGLSDRA
jgi:decaprenylphospho-beta-D-ribofuranose 2-oxidase